MARIRNVKPDLWANELLSSCTPEAHMLAAALLCYADDDGYFNAHPELVRSGCLPLRDLSHTIPVLLSELAGIGYITLGRLHHKRVGRIVQFHKHQRVAKPTRTRWPVEEIEWDANCTDSDTATTPLPEDYGTATGTVPEGSTTFSTLLPDGSATVPVEVRVGSGSGSGMGNGNGRGSEKSIARRASRNRRHTDDEPPGFTEFWNSYPRKEAKARALKAWTKNECEGMAQRIVSDVAQRKAANWLGKETEFIPHPASYINGARWKDALIYPEPPKPDTGRIGAAADRLRARLASHDARMPVAVGAVVEDFADDWGIGP